MKDLINAIDEKFGNQARFVLNMDLSGCIELWHKKDEKFYSVFDFENILELTISQIDGFEFFYDWFQMGYVNR